MGTSDDDSSDDDRIDDDRIDHDRIDHDRIDDDRIDYDRGAATFRQGRTLPPAVLAAWSDAVNAVGVRGADLTLDLGAGTGQFLSPLVQWFGARVVGVEPSSGMRAQAMTSCPESATLVGGRSEALPLAAHCVDVAWLSTVIHQVDDRKKSLDELARVVSVGGWVLVRGWFADLPMSRLFALFPGIDRARSVFPATDELVDDFEVAGFETDAVTGVEEVWSFDRDDWEPRLRSLHRFDSALRHLTDDELERGIRAIVDATADEPGPLVNRGVLRLIVFRR